SHGILNFNVNDFDEGHCEPCTWDVKRPLALLNLVAHSKACEYYERTPCE
ncbi:unnamed protein product, partial [Rotaria sordida]